MNPEDEIRTDFDELVRRGRNRTCKRRRDPQNDPYFVDVDFVEDGNGGGGAAAAPIPQDEERAPAALNNVRIASAVPSGMVPKTQKSPCLRRNVSAHGPVQQRPKKIRRSLNFNIPSNAPGGNADLNRVPDNPPGERAAAGRRNDVQAAAVHERAKAPDPAASPEQRALVPWNAMSSKPFSSAGRGLQQYMGKQPWSIVQTASTSQQSVGEADSQYTAIYLVAAECR
ncbi:uncharacterized protein LOC125487263 [Rhincodon typus]|uniref:uncharacterized protein LOC125487263 n=1 Tax=Rhincodon typus TaxID=259920 RepID=UPI00202E2BD1|nr:uncharacterized protein LOC125487263 [Rhincodon typus]